MAGECVLLTNTIDLAQSKGLPTAEVQCPPEISAACTGLRCGLAEQKGLPFDEAGFLETPTIPRSPEVTNFEVGLEIHDYLIS
jgi:hypothetical protein